MKGNNIIFISFFYLIISATPLLSKYKPEDIDSAIAKRNIIKAQAIIDVYDGVHNFEFFWRAARVYLVVGDQYQSKTFKVLAYQKSIEFAENTIAANPNSPVGYIRRAMGYGKLAVYMGFLDQREIVSKAKSDLDKGLSLATNNDYYYALGHFTYGHGHLILSDYPYFFRLPLGLQWGNLGDAEKHFKEAISKEPNFIIFRLDYAKALINLNRIDDALTELQMVEKLPLREYGDESLKKEARELLKKIKS